MRSRPGRPRADENRMQSSVSGMGVASTLVDVAAHNIANSNTGGFRPQRAEIAAVEPTGGAAVARISAEAPEPPPGLSGTDLATEMVSLVVGGAAYSANATALVTRDQMTRDLLDVLA